MTEIRLQVTSHISDFDAPSWDRLVENQSNPFVMHAFLELLERSKSIGVGTGWEPFYIGAFNHDELVGATFVYLKDHSYGEYIFDWAFADVAQQLGLPYYPKLVCAIPFTPATGPRLISSAPDDADLVRDALLHGVFEVQKELGAHSIHFLFCLDEEARFLEERDFIRRASHQFHWRNANYACFDDFLGAFKSRARKQIRKERARLDEANIKRVLISGSEASAEDWNIIYRFYTSTIGRKWGSPYLSRQFFDLAKESLGELSILGLAYKDGTPIAGTLSFKKSKHLYGRYWGAVQYVDGLHFDMCYYQLIDYAISNKLRLVEAGAQGEHKIKRGYVPMVTHSGHWFANPRLHQLVSQFLKRERASYEREIPHWASICPFKENHFPEGPLCAGLPEDDGSA